MNKNQDGRKAKKLKNSFQPTFWKFGESLSAEADSADFHLEGLPGLANVLHLDVHDRQPGQRVNVRVMLVSDRVAEVGKLSASAKNAFNSFVGRVFANLRQKTLFFRVLPKLQQKR